MGNDWGEGLRPLSPPGYAPELQNSVIFSERAELISFRRFEPMEIASN